MIHRIALALVTVLVSMLLAVGLQAPAQAAYGTSVGHAADDSGYNAMIQVICNTGKRVWLSPGERTFLGRDEEDSCSLSGVDRIVVGYEQMVSCQNLVPPWQSKNFYPGSTDVGSNQTWKCYMKRKPA